MLLLLVSSFSSQFICVIEPPLAHSQLVSRVVKIHLEEFVRFLVDDRLVFQSFFCLGNVLKLLQRFISLSSADLNLIRLVCLQLLCFKSDLQRSLLEMDVLALFLSLQLLSLLLYPLPLKLCLAPQIIYLGFALLKNCLKELCLTLFLLMILSLNLQCIEILPQLHQLFLKRLQSLLEHAQISGFKAHYRQKIR